MSNEKAPTAEPVAQGEADLCDCDADKYNKLPHHADCAVLAAQPRAVLDPETACAMWVMPTTTDAEIAAFLAGARAMLAAAQESDR